MPFTIETEAEDDGRWLAEVIELPGVMAYGQTRQAAVERAQVLCLRVVADRIEHGELGPEDRTRFLEALGKVADVEPEERDRT
jgi:predicted RNase H-like HicB family nuclease